MSRTLVNILGAVFLLIGVLGFVAPHMAGAHLGMAHNIIHLGSGALALYFGLKGSASAFRAFCWVFGLVYGLLGIVGFIAGVGTERMLSVIPGQLVLGTMDHIIHIVLGALFVIAALSASRAILPRHEHRPV